MMKKMSLVIILINVVAISAVAQAQSFFLGAGQEKNTPSTKTMSSQPSASSDYKKNVRATYEKKKQTREQEFNDNLAKKMGATPKKNNASPPNAAAAPPPSNKNNNGYSSSISNEAPGSTAPSPGGANAGYYSGFQNQPTNGSTGSTKSPSAPTSGGGWNIKY